MSEAELIQRSDEWRTARCGSLGASSVHEAIARTKTGWGASRANRMAALIVERLTGAPEESYINAAMQHGIDTEPEARNAYIFLTDAGVTEIGLMRHPSIVGSHASPDGLVEPDGLLEIKCPQPATHLDFLLNKAIPDKYQIQMQWQMACTGRQWCDFVSYHPSFPPRLRLFIKRVPRDDARIAELEFLVTAFLAELDLTVAALEEL